MNTKLNCKAFASKTFFINYVRRKQISVLLSATYIFFFNPTGLNASTIVNTSTIRKSTILGHFQEALAFTLLQSACFQCDNNA